VGRELVGDDGHGLRAGIDRLALHVEHRGRVEAGCTRLGREHADVEGLVERRLGLHALAVGVELLGGDLEGDLVLAVGALDRGGAGGLR